MSIYFLKKKYILIHMIQRCLHPLGLQSLPHLNFFWQQHKYCTVKAEAALAAFNHVVFRFSNTVLPLQSSVIVR